MVSKRQYASASNDNVNNHTLSYCSDYHVSMPTLARCLLANYWKDTEFIIVEKRKSGHHQNSEERAYYILRQTLQQLLRYQDLTVSCPKTRNLDNLETT